MPDKHETQKRLVNNFDLHHYIFDQSDLTSTEKLVAFTIASHRNSFSLACYPSIERLAGEASLSKRCIYKIVKSLEEKGVIKVERKYGKPNSYYFPFDTPRDEYGSA